jgi:predicted nucleotidyltransferase
MRLSDIERKTIKNSLKEIDPNASVYLFGSRVDDQKKGGDIDLLVFSNKMALDEEIQFQSRLWNVLGEQKIDVIIANTDNKNFVNYVMQEAVLL